MTINQVRSLADAFPYELTRVRELREEYSALGSVGTFGYVMLTSVIQRAERALANGDVVAMARSYEEMKGCE